MLEWALNQLGPWLEARRHKADKSDAAARAVLLAVNETKAYIADTESGRSLDRARERVLVQLWTEAAVAVRRTDAELAERLQMKAESWADPSQWSADDIRKARISIEVVAAAARALLVEPD